MVPSRNQLGDWTSFELLKQFKRCECRCVAGYQGISEPSYFRYFPVCLVVRSAKRMSLFSESHAVCGYIACNVMLAACT